MLEEAAHSVTSYDPFYADKLQRLTQRYDFITVSETAEHFFNPREEFDLLWSLLRPNGYLGIMTLMLQSPEQFEQWHYRKDDTHVVFRSEERRVREECRTSRGGRRRGMTLGVG